MTIIYKLDTDGGFTCGDTETQVTSYAYPTSFYASDAARNAAMAQRTAEVMIAKEMARHAMGSIGYDSPSVVCVREFDARNWAKLAAVPAGWDKVDTSV